MIYTIEDILVLPSLNFAWCLHEKWCTILRETLNF